MVSNKFFEIFYIESLKLMMISVTLNIIASIVV